MENVSPIENGARKQRRRRRRQQQRRRHSHEDFRSAMMVSPTKDMERQYKEYGLPSAPKHPINRKTMPLDKVLKQVKDGSFGEEVREICYGQEEDDEIDMESIRRVLFLGGRDFGDGVPRLRNGRMAELVGLVLGLWLVPQIHCTRIRGGNAKVYRWLLFLGILWAVFVLY